MRSEPLWHPLHFFTVLPGLGKLSLTHQRDVGFSVKRGDLNSNSANSPIL